MTACLEEMSEKEFIIYLIKITHEAKNDIRENMQAMNNHSKEQLKEQLQEAKDHFNKQCF